MRILAIVGVCLIVLGIVALGFQSITYFTMERVVDAGPLHIDVERPHTIVFHPVAAGVAIVVGLALVIVGISGHRRYEDKNGLGPVMPRHTDVVIRPIPI